MSLFGVAIAVDAKDADLTRGEAIATLSTMVGAMTLARIASDNGLTTEILDRAREH